MHTNEIDTEATTCADMVPGQAGTITDIAADTALAGRLKALGIKPGLHLTVVRRAPWGCPIEVAIRNVHLALRREDADAIRIDGRAAAAA